MTRRLAGIALSLVALLVLASACSSPEPAPTATAVPTALPTATATPEPTPLPSPTPEPTGTPTPEPTVTATPEPPDVLFRYAFAVRLLDSAQWPEAVQEFDIVIRVLPEFAQAYHGRGLAFYNDEKEELALEDFTKAIELKPDFADAYRNRGVLHLNVRRIPEGVADLREARRLYLEAGITAEAAEVERLIDSAGP